MIWPVIYFLPMINDDSLCRSPYQAKDRRSIVSYLSSVPNRWMRVSSWAESYLMFSVHQVRGIRRETWLTLGICILAFSLSAGMRLLEFPRWDPAEHQVDDEYILATHDAYFWVAGAEGVNQRSDGTPMAILLGVGAVLFQNSPAQIAFWAPVFLAALAAIPIALWALQLGAPYAAPLAAVLGSLAPAFYSRTRLGYYDTDWATSFFPLMIGWLLMVWIQPRLRVPKHTEDDESTARFELQKPTIIVLVVAVGTPWHSFIALYLISLLWIATAFVVLFGRKGTKGSSFTVLLAIALTVGLGWWGAVLGLTLLWARGRFTQAFGHPWAWRVTILILVIFLMFLTWTQFEGYISTTLSTYAAWLMQDIAPNSIKTTLIYPEIVASLRETQQLSVPDTFKGIGFFKLAGILGVLGYGIMLWKKPITVFLFPLLLLGFASIRLGARFTMFAAPVVFLGLFVPLDWSVAHVSQKYGWGNKTRGLIAVISLILGLVLVYQTYARLPIEPAVSKSHAETLLELGEIAHPESTVWTWWDYGYATQHYSGLSTFSDGGRNSGEYLFTLGHVFGSQDSHHSAGMVRFAVEEEHLPWDSWGNWDEGEMETWLDELGNYDDQGSLDLPQYLVVQWEAVPFLPWIQYYGSWDFDEGEGQQSRVVQVVSPVQLDLETGEFIVEGEGTGFVVTVDILDEGGAQHYDYPENAGGPHLLLDAASSQVLLLDEQAYESILVQLLISVPGELTNAEPYVLMIDGFPSTRVFRLE